MRSPALHRSSTRAIPFDRSHAFAPHPCRPAPAEPAPSRGSGLLGPRYFTLAAAGADLMSGKDAPYRLLQTCHFSSTPRIGGFSSVSRVLFSAAIRACPRADRSPSVSPRVATRIDGAPRALGNCRRFDSPARLQIGNRARCRPWSPLGLHVLFGPCFRLSPAFRAALRSACHSPSGPCRTQRGDSGQSL